MKSIYSLLFLFMPCVLFSQLTVVSTDPPNNAKNVPLTTTISITFSEAIDTVSMNSEDAWFSNIDSMISYGYSGDLKTAYGTYQLKANTAYFYAFIFAKAKSGAVLTTPAVYYFTTGSEFPPYTVSGTVSAGSTGVSPENAIVGLMTVPIQKSQGEGPPPFAGWTNVNANGTFTVPYVPNGTYWPISVKDANHDGKIDPESGADVMAFSEDSIVVNNASVTNVVLTFTTFAPKILSDVIADADSASKDLPADKQLKRISGWRSDTLGRSNSWEFAYTTDGNTTGYRINIESFGGTKTETLDPNYFNWIKNLRTLTNYNSAASSAAVIANVEAAGGKTVRTQQGSDSLQFKIEMSLADQNMSQYGHLVPDQTKFYWGVTYSWGKEYPDQWIDVSGKHFLCDFTTGAVINSSTLSVKDEKAAPLSFELFQNYPNPFNPVTTISFTVPTSGHAALKVINVLGQEVARLFDGTAEAGRYYNTQFNGFNAASGVYFSRLEYNGKVLLRKMVMIK